jgi:hypothetical protein
MVKKFHEIFENSETYPDQDSMAENGVPQDTEYINISRTYLNGFINCVRIYKSILLQKELSDYDWSKLTPENLQCGTSNTDYGEYPDDVVVFAETTNSLWYFWCKELSSECCIGRVSKDKITKEDFFNLFIETYKESYTEEYIELLPPKGWINF